MTRRIDNPAQYRTVLVPGPPRGHRVLRRRPGSPRPGPATITRRLCTVAGFYRYAVEEDGSEIEALGIERGHRTLVITRKGGKIVTIPLAPRTARAIDLAIGERSEGLVFLRMRVAAGTREPLLWAASADLAASSRAIRIWAICAGIRRAGMNWVGETSGAWLGGQSSAAIGLRLLAR